MPELPEVQTTVDGLNKTVKGLVISGVYTDIAKNSVSRPDYKESIKYLPFFNKFKKTVIGTKIISAERRAKNILINLSNEYSILIHMKMTGHLLFGKYTQKANKWVPSNEEKNKALSDPYNGHIHFVLEFKNKKHLVLSDVRKFAKVTLLKTSEAHSTKHLSALGPEIFEKSFSAKIFAERISKKPNGRIKSVLMDQSIIAGIGNIYSDEALYLASIHPNSVVKNIPDKTMTILFNNTKSVLQKGIDFGGDSMSDYRRIDGTPGNFSHEHNVYRRRNLPCKNKKCGGVIMRSVIGGRSAHYCPRHQKLWS